MSWTKSSQNSTNYGKNNPTYSLTVVAPKGSPIGLALILTYAQQISTTTTYIGYHESYNKINSNNTNWVKQ